MPVSLRQDAAEPRSQPVLREAEAAGRAPLEVFIARRFREVYGAELYAFMPRLFGLHAASGELLAAFGLRAADQHALFLERYLEQPVEAVVGQRCGRSTPRRRIVEVGNLAGATPGALRLLIPMLCEALYREGYRWITFTGAARLCNGFARLGLPLQVVAEASPQRLPAQERERWGSYYDAEPSVMLGDLRGGWRLLRQRAETAQGLHGLLAPMAAVGAP